MSNITPLGAKPTALAKAREVAEFLNTTPNQLSRLRYEGHGPDYVKLGRSVRYRCADVHRWVDENVQTARVRGGVE